MSAKEISREEYPEYLKKKMAKWTDEKLNKEDAFSKGDEAGWEGEQWRIAIDNEKARRYGR